MAFLAWGFDPTTSVYHSAYVDSNNLVHVLDPNTPTSEKEADKPNTGETDGGTTLGS